MNNRELWLAFNYQPRVPNTCKACTTNYFIWYGLTFKWRTYPYAHFEFTMCVHEMHVQRSQSTSLLTMLQRGDLDIQRLVITWIRGRLISNRRSSRELDSQCVTQIHGILLSCNLYLLPWWSLMQGRCADLSLSQLDVANEMLNKRIQRYVWILELVHDVHNCQ